MTKLYYTPPPDKQFDEVKERAIEVWNTCDNAGGYRDKKVNSIKDIKNIQDNFMYMVAMFDEDNQKKLAGKLTDKTREAVCRRIKDRGMPDRYNMFL